MNSNQIYKQLKEAGEFNPLWIGVQQSHALAQMSTGDYYSAGEI